jgi:hypothetical protein
MPGVAVATLSGTSARDGVLGCLMVQLCEHQDAVFAMIPERPDRLEWRWICTAAICTTAAEQAWCAGMLC